MPYNGTKINTPSRRMAMDTTLIRKDRVAFPKPFKILVNNVPKYRKGHMKLRVLINRPASGLLKISFPIKGPVK